MLLTRVWISRLALALLIALTSTTLAHAVVVQEDCDNCVDDDGDTFIDRKDADCSVPANGMGLNINDQSEGKALAACAKAVQKAGFKFVLGTMKQFQKCTQAAEKCIQAKPGDADCQAKATATCAKTLGAGFDGAAAKLEAAIVAKCDPEGEHIDALKALAGLGFLAEQEQCLADTNGAVADVDTIQKIASCIAQQHFCRAQHLVVIGTPRAREFLTFAGRQPSEFPCIDEADEVVSTNGAGTGVAADHVKKLLKCSKTIDKLAQSLVAAGAKPVQNCLNAGIACLQVKPQSAACLAKAQAKCGAAFVKLQDPFKGTVAKLAAKLVKACSVQEGLDLADIAAPNGLGFGQGVQNHCTALNDNIPLGFPQCLGAQAFCQGAYLIERQVPRARELADILGIEIPGIIE